MLCAWPGNLGTHRPAMPPRSGARWSPVLARCRRVGGGTGSPRWTGSPRSSGLGRRVRSELIRKDLEVFSRQFRSSPELFNTPLHSTAGRRNWGSSLPGWSCLFLIRGTAVPGTGGACGTAPCCRAALASAGHAGSGKGTARSAPDPGRMEPCHARRVLEQAGCRCGAGRWELSAAEGKDEDFKGARDARGVLARWVLSGGAGVGARSSPRVLGTPLVIAESVF